MSFTRPTVPELIARIQDDIEGAVSGVSARIRRTVEYGIARALAGAAHGLHGHLAWLALQVVPGPDMAERFVLLWADRFLEVGRIDAAQATGTATATGSGGTLPAGTEVVRLADGVSYTVDAEVVGVSGTGSTVVMTAVETGLTANMASGETVSLVSPIANVDSVMTIDSAGLTGGVDIETIPALLARLLLSIKNPPLGGARGDYVKWALQVPGVTRAWEYRGLDGVGNPAAGKVAVTFVRDGDGSIIPDAGEVAAVQSYLDARAPSQVIVFAPTAVAFDFTASIVPNTAAVQAAAEAEVAAFILRTAEPGATILWSQVNEAISAATGETDHTLTTPAADKAHAYGQLAVAGTATWS